MIRVQTDDFEVAAEYKLLRKHHHGQAGAIVSFIGLVRDLNDDEAIQEMTLEHYPGMTEKALEKIEQQARDQYNLIDCLIIHRVGPLQPDDQIVLVIAMSPHRQDAFLGCEFMIDVLKTRAPFWKKEKIPSGERWVEQKASDAERAGDKLDSKPIT